MSVFTIKPTTRADVPTILSFIKGIAEYEKMSDQVRTTEEILERSLFDQHAAECVIGYEDEQPVGFALYFYNFSTFEGIAGLYLEDLFVWPEHRGKGYGKKLLLHLAKKACDLGCRRMEWVCLDWNQPSIDFYLSLGAKPMDEWTIYRLTRDRLEALSAEQE